MGLDGIRNSHLAQLRRQPPVTADGTLDEAFVRQSVQAPTLPVAGRHGEHETEVARRSGGQEALFQGQRELLGKALPDKALDNN